MDRSRSRTSNAISWIPALECRPYESPIYARVISLTTEASDPVRETRGLQQSENRAGFTATFPCRVSGKRDRRAKVSSKSESRMPRRSIRSASASFDITITPLLRLNFWNVLSSVAKDARHPDQFIQEFVEALHVTLIEQIPLLIEKLLQDRKSVV